MFDPAKVEAAAPIERESMEFQHLYPGLNEPSLFAQNAFVPAALHSQGPSPLQHDQQLLRDMSRHTSHVTSEAPPFTWLNLSHNSGRGSCGTPLGEMGSGLLSNTLDSWRTSGIRVSESSASSIDESVDVGAQANPSGIYPVLHPFPGFDQQKQQQHQQQQQQAGGARDVARPTSSTERPTHPAKGAHGKRESSSDRRPRRSAARKGTSVRAAPSTAALRAATRAAAAASVVAASAKIAAARAEARAAARAATASPPSSGRRREATGPGPSKQQESHRATAFTTRRAQEIPPCTTFTLPVPGSGVVTDHASMATQWSDRWALRPSRSAFPIPPPERPPSPPFSQGLNVELGAMGSAKRTGVAGTTNLEAQIRTPSKVLSPDSEDPDFWLTGMAWTAPKVETMALPAPLLVALRSDGGEAKDDEETALFFHHDTPSLHGMEGGSRADVPRRYGGPEGGGEDAELSGNTDDRSSRVRKRKPQWGEEPDRSSFSPFLPDSDAPGGDQRWWGVDSFDSTISSSITRSRGNVAAHQLRQSQPFFEAGAAMCTSDGTCNHGGEGGLVDPSARIAAAQCDGTPSFLFSPSRTPTPPARDSPEDLRDPTLPQPPPPQLKSENVHQLLLPPLPTTASLPSWARHPSPLLDLTVIAPPLHPPGGGTPRKSDGRSVPRPREAATGDHRASHAHPSGPSTPDPPRSTSWGCEEGGCRAPADYELAVQPKGGSGSRGRGPERRNTRWCAEHRQEGSELSRAVFCSYPGCRLRWSWGYEPTVDKRKNPIRCCVQHKHDG